jgi:phosphoribosyl-AMP cyclohydrolase
VDAQFQLTPVEPREWLALVRYDSDGLVPAIVQDAGSNQVLMMAWMNEASLRQSLDLGETVFWSRSRREFWHKGATSGNTQRIVDVRLDCDGDTLLLRVEPAGPACHTGAVSCFYRVLMPDGADV